MLNINGMPLLAALSNHLGIAESCISTSLHHREWILLLWSKICLKSTRPEFGCTILPPPMLRLIPTSFSLKLGIKSPTTITLPISNLNTITIALSPANPPVNNNTIQCKIHHFSPPITTLLSNNTTLPLLEPTHRHKCHSSPLGRHPRDTGEGESQIQRQKRYVRKGKWSFENRKFY